MGLTTRATRPGYSIRGEWSWRLQVIGCSDQLRNWGTSTLATALTATVWAMTFFSRFVLKPVKVWREPATLPNFLPFGGLLSGSSRTGRAFSISLREWQSAVVCVAGFPSLL